MKDAAEKYLQAISIGFAEPFRSGALKLRYAKILRLQYNSYAYHYAREAEKDFRKHLRKRPDDLWALESLLEALEVPSISEQLKRSDLMNSVKARIKEVETARKIKGARRIVTNLPWETEGPYPDKWKDISQAAKKRDGYRCAQCGASDVELHVHHMTPLSQGGTSEIDNLITLCRYCHSPIHPRMGETPF